MMDVTEMECEIDPVAIGRSSETDTVEENPLFQEWDLMDQDMTGVKVEYVDQSHDLTSEVIFEDDLEPNSFPVMEREPEEETIRAVTGEEEKELELVQGQSEVLTERLNRTPGALHYT
ncbi:uncharacterized protein [Periplaneta americana]|uniref:uncharacterized protein isoform X5 n=1 Tax=Periplaneta americana TaxID=6978 RepID=UPI0037E781FC